MHTHTFDPFGMVRRLEPIQQLCVNLSRLFTTLTKRMSALVIRARGGIQKRGRLSSTHHAFVKVRLGALVQAGMQCELRYCAYT